MKWRSLEESEAGPETRPLREIFAERKELIEKYVPADARAIHARVVAELKAGGIADRALHEGSQAPPFTLKDHQGKGVSSAELLARGPLAVCFFRGRWDPFCCGQMEAMNQSFPRSRRQAHPWSASLRRPCSSPSSWPTSISSRFPLLSDAGNQVARQFGLAYRVPEEQQALYRRTFVNLPFVNGDESWELPIPATYVIGRDGRVRFASADADYTARIEPTEILDRLIT